ncbi:MAG: anti-sigma factor [Acidimicrobiia bacterium]|nr:anti-sigma factor [Acidimicrobiia bacterium]
MTPRDQNQPQDSTRELLGAYVLDAVDDVERRRVENLLASDSSARDEVERLRVAADKLGEASASVAPPQLWESIHSEINSALPIAANSGVAEPTSISSSKQLRRSNKSFLAAAAVLAVFVIGGAIFAGLRQENNVPDTIAAMTAMANDAASKPGSRTGFLSDPDQTMKVQVVADAQGHGFLMTDPLPALPENQTYQLWAANNGTMISLGMLGSNPEMSLVPIDPSVTELALTREPMSGSISPTSDPMATGFLA